MTPTEAYRIGYREVLAGSAADYDQIARAHPQLPPFTILQLELAYENGRLDAVEALYEKENGR